jgi:hypothetical protein
MLSRQLFFEFIALVRLGVNSSRIVFRSLLFAKSWFCCWFVLSAAVERIVKMWIIFIVSETKNKQPFQKEIIEKERVEGEKKRENKSSLGIKPGQEPRPEV